VVVRACRKPSDALALRSNRLDPIRERLQKFAGDAMTERGPWRGQSNCPISTMSSFIEDGASEISAFANIPLNDAFRRLPTNTPTLTGLSMVILHYDISARSEPGSPHS